ncbi:DUF4956 domain-containing protein [Candidatus Marinamargulisbacteria bacterium SCGC AG-410-N11]|nr:DUF4956 domain-containing protein [Candidatus Marinamargulisbacteria bacterium SCGC AG-410-N11]
MNKVDTFENFLAIQGGFTSPFIFAINLILVALLSYILSVIYIHYGQSISNRRSFSYHFVLISMSTMIIISIVKSSLALSLGLVGALSIVRFRTAIKEPEELSYLFFNIALGLGFGANQKLVTIIGFVLVCSYIFIRNWKKRVVKEESLILNISFSPKIDISLEKLVNLIEPFCSQLELRRFEYNNNIIDASFIFESPDTSKITKIKEVLLKKDKSAQIQLLSLQHL